MRGVTTSQKIFARSLKYVFWWFGVFAFCNSHFAKFRKSCACYNKNPLVNFVQGCDYITKLLEELDILNFG